MQGRRQERRRDHRCPSARLNECHMVIPADLVLYSQTLVKLNEVGAAPQKNMLAVVHHFPCSRVLIRRGAASQIWPPLEQSHLQAALSQSTCRGQPRQSASDDRHLGGQCPGLGSHSRRFHSPFARMFNFSQRVRLIFPWNTSNCWAAIFSSSR